MTTLDIDLADILGEKYPHGFHVPVDIDLSQFLEYGDDDWDHELDLDALLERDRKAAVVFSAEAAQAVRPHLTDDQAWEVARLTRDEFAAAVDDFLGDVADANFPTVQLRLLRRAFDLEFTLRRNPARREAELLANELAGIQRMIKKLPEGTGVNPALEGAIAAALDDLERAVSALSTATGEALS